MVEDRIFRTVKYMTRDSYDKFIKFKKETSQKIIITHEAKESLKGFKDPKSEMAVLISINSPMTVEKIAELSPEGLTELAKAEE